MTLYRLLPHTADLKVSVSGDSLEELFQKGGESLVSLITDRRRVRGKVKVESTLFAPDLEELFFNYLRWVYSLVYVEDFLTRRMVARFPRGRGKVMAEAWGEAVDYSRHLMRTEVKGVTLHQLNLSLKGKVFRGTYVLDV